MANTEKSLPQIQSFYDTLKRHDWFTCFSDDSSVYNRGEARTLELEKFALENGPVYLWLYKSFSKHMSSGVDYGTLRHPLPPRPSGLTIGLLIDLRSNYEQRQLDALAFAAHCFCDTAMMASTDEATLKHMATLALEDKALLSQAFYLGAYSAPAPAPPLVSGAPELAASWAEGAAEVQAFATAETARVGRELQRPQQVVIPKLSDAAYGHEDADW